MAADIPRALKLPVGLNDSSLTNRCLKLASSLLPRTRSSGVTPSPIETASSGRSTGRTSANFQNDRSRRERTTAGVNDAASRSRSYSANKGRAQLRHTFCKLSIAWTRPHAAHFRFVCTLEASSASLERTVPGRLSAPDVLQTTPPRANWEAVFVPRRTGLRVSPKAARPTLPLYASFGPREGRLRASAASCSHKWRTRLSP